MKSIEAGVGRGISAGPSIGTARIAGAGMRPMGFAGAEAPRSMMSMGARTLAKGWSPMRIEAGSRMQEARSTRQEARGLRQEAGIRSIKGNEIRFNPFTASIAEKGTNRPFLAPRERQNMSTGRKTMDNIQIRQTIQRRLQGARYQGAPEVTVHKGITNIQLEPPVIPNIQRVSTPERRAMRVLNLVGSRMPFAISRETPSTTLNFAQKKTEAPKGMEVVFPSQINPKPEIRMGQVTNPATTPAISTETAQALRAVSALKKAGMVDQARRVAENIKPEQRNISQVAKVIEMPGEEIVKKQQAVKKMRRETEEDMDSKKGLKKFKLIRDESAFKARVEIVIKTVKRLFGKGKVITGSEVLAEIPSSNINKDLKSEVVKDTERNDHTWETYIPNDLKPQKFESEEQALDAIGVSLERHEPVTIAENGKKVGVDALRKVYNAEQDQVLRPVSDSGEEIVFKTERVQTMHKETVWVDDEIVSQRSESKEDTKIEEPKTKIDLIGLGIMPDWNELLKKTV